MAEWRDRAIILSARAHGESGFILQLLTETRGRHAGMVRGSAGRRGKGGIEPGTLVMADWRARLDAHLGNLTLEIETTYAARVFADASRLLALQSAMAIAERALPEREPHPRLFAGLEAWLDSLDGPVFAATLVAWEMGLLTEIGFGLDLGRCAVTGGSDDLAFVSPRTGRAVSREGAGDWAGRLLPLPGFLVGTGEASDAAVLDGLALTGHFLQRAIFDPLDRPLPEPRMALVERLAADSRRHDPHE